METTDEKKELRIGFIVRLSIRFFLVPHGVVRNSQNPDIAWRFDFIPDTFYHLHFLWVLEGW